MIFLHYMKLTVFGKLIKHIIIRCLIRIIVLPGPDDVSHLRLVVITTSSKA